jgi:hypothetical protein
LDGTSVTDAGIAGLECIVTLTKLSLVHCDFITSDQETQSDDPYL